MSDTPQKDDEGAYRDTAGRRIARCGTAQIHPGHQRGTDWMRCHRCNDRVGQVMRKESDVFDCIECGAMTYIGGCNTSKPIRLRALNLIAQAPTLEEAQRIARRAIADSEA